MIALVTLGVFDGGPPMGFCGTRDEDFFDCGIRDWMEFCCGIRDLKVARDAG